MVVPGTNYPTSSSVDADRKYFSPDVDASIFTTPHSVTRPDLPLFDAPAPTVAFDIAPPYPASVNLYASTAKTCLLTCNPNDEWAMADFRTSNTSGDAVVYFFSGFAGSPMDLNAEGRECFGNIMYMLTTSP